MSDQEKSMREEMEEAVSQIEENDGEEENNNEDNYVEETPKIEKEEAQAASGTDINGDEPAAKPGADEQKPGADDSKPGADGKQAVEAEKAPVSWSPKLREDFAKLPSHVQTQINKREAEITKSLNDGAESRKFGDRMTQTLQPYQAVMQAHGTNDPAQAVEGLMKTAAQLQMGTPQQKAQKIADLIQHYGVDIQTLDGTLSGAPAANPQQNQLEQILEQKLAPMNQFMNSVQQNQQQQQQQVQQNATSEVAQFEQKAEFINDVRNDMADLLDMAVKRGQAMTLQEAYDKAVALNPEISGILSQRQQDDAIKGNQQMLSDKRNAASSVNGGRVGGDAPAAGSDSIEALLNQAWDDHNR